MRLLSRSLWLGIAVLSFVVSAQAQQAPVQQPPERVIINFIVPVTPDSVNQLMSVVNAQVRNGTKKITIVISSSGGDPNAGFAAYNFLRNVQAEITTFNGGAVDSAALLIYCGGKYRYSLPDPSRFLIHPTALNPMTTSVNVESRWLESQLAQLKSFDQVMTQVIMANSTKKQSEIENAIRIQTILSPEDAKQWGLVQDIRPSYMEAGAVFVGVNVPPEKEQKQTPSPYTSDGPSISSGNVKKLTP
jgi:ATP-dependent Clp protease protease subunit